MKVIKLEQKAIPIDVNGKIKFTPAVRLDSGKFHPISQNGKILIYDTSEEAEDYFEEPNEKLKEAAEKYLGTLVKTPILEWEKLDGCSQRLKGVLRHVVKGTYSNIKESYIEDINIRQMRRLPNCGTKTLKEFIQKRGY